MKLVLLFCVITLINACDYRSYSYSLTFGDENSYAQVKYQYPNGPSISVFRNRMLVQEIYLTDDLGPYIEQYPIQDGFALKGEGREIHITRTVNEAGFFEFKVFRELMRDEKVRDCLLFAEGSHWYGGPSHFSQQHWPVEKQRHVNTHYITQYDLAITTAERVWFNSKGVYAYVDKSTPLFITQEPNQSLCFRAAKEQPYNQDDSRYTYTYHIGIATNAREAYLKAVDRHLGKPSAIPDERMALEPIFSTRAMHYKNVNEVDVRAYLAGITDHGFEASQIEIDDSWEDCYGSLNVDTTKFPNMKQLIEDVQAEGIRVTLWVHPFINHHCEEAYNEAKTKGYFTKDANDLTDVTWWNSGVGNPAGSIDFTNPAAADWFAARLRTVQEALGVDSFKFDSGESMFVRRNAVLSGDKTQHPSLFTKSYVDMAASFGNLIEVMTGWGTQNHPNFIRMSNKDSNWGGDISNGLGSLLFSLFQLNLNGYPFVLPDVIGGNAAIDPPSKELFTRWLQATAFMPAMQFSIPPWFYEDQDLIDLAKACTELHKTLAGPVILAAMNKAVEDGSPVNAPVWWIAPNDEEALGIFDEFLLGETILVAPILTEGAVKRDIYLPAGSWRAPDGQISDGPMWLANYPAPLDTVPFFVLQSTDLKKEL